MKKRCKIKPPSNRYKKGSVLRGIGAGAYGLAEGILDTATLGLTDELTDKGFEGLQNLAKTPEEERTTQKGIKGTANIVGAGTAAIGASTLAPGLAPKMYKSAIEEGVEGTAGALDATNNEALGTAGEGLTMASNVAMPFLKFKYGGVTPPHTNMYKKGGGEDPPPSKFVYEDENYTYYIPTEIEFADDPEFLFSYANPKNSNVLSDRIKKIMIDQGADLEYFNEKDGTFRVAKTNKENKTTNIPQISKQVPETKQVWSESMQMWVPRTELKVKNTNMYPNGGPGLTGYLGYDTRYSGSPIGGISYGQQFKANEGFHIPSLSLYGSKYGPGIKGGYTYINPNRMGTVAPFVTTEIGYDPKRRGYAGFKGGAQFNILNNRYNKLSVSPQAGFSVMTPAKGMVGLQKGDIGLPDYTQLEYGLGADYEKTFDNKSKLGFYGRFFIDPISGKLKEASQGKTTEQLEQDLQSFEGGNSYDETVRDLDSASEGLRGKTRVELGLRYKLDPNARRNKKIKEIIAKQNAQKTLDEQTKPSIENYTFMRDYKKRGGNMYANGGYGNNNMNQIPVTQFGNGGSHEDNPLGGIPQGMGANGKMNLVEEGELKIPDPRPQSEGGFFIVSADPTMKITKDIANTYNLPKKLVGKSVLKAAESILRKGTGREGDAIEENSINIDLANFLDAHEELTARKEAQEEGKFMEELAKLEEKYPEYMEALMGGGQEAPMEEMPMDPSMQGMPPQGPPQMSPEEQAMMEQQMMAQQQGGMPQGMPPGAMPMGAQGMDPAMMGGMPPEAMGMPMMYGGEMYAKGGKMPKEVLRARAESHMSKEAADEYVNNYGYGGSDGPDYSNYVPIKNRRGKVKGFRIKDNSDYADHSTRALPIVDRTIFKPRFFNKGNEEWEKVMNAYEENPNQFSMYYNPFKYGGSNMYDNGGGKDEKNNPNPKYWSEYAQDYLTKAEIAKLYTDAAHTYGTNRAENSHAFQALRKDYLKTNPTLFQDAFQTGYHVVQGMRNALNSAFGTNYKMGGNMIKRADGSYSPWGLWDSIRNKAKKNKAAGKKGKEPTKEMLEQEKKIRGNSKMYGSKMYENGGSFDNPGFKALPKNVQDKIKGNSMGYGSNMYKYGTPPYWGPGIIAPYKNKKYLDNPFGITPARIKNVSATRTVEHPEGGYGFWDGDNPPSITYNTQPLNKRGVARFRNPKSFNVDLEEFDYERTPLQAQGAYFGNVNYDGSEPDTANMQVYKRGLLDRTFNPEYQDLIYKEAKDIYKKNYKDLEVKESRDRYKEIKNKKEMGGNMYKYGSTMGNMYHEGGAEGHTHDEGIGIGDPSYNNVSFDYEPNPLNIAAQYIPAAANIGMGLFAPSEDYTGALGRMQPVDMPEIVPGQELVNINQGFASAQDALGAVTGTTPGAYLSGLQTLQDSKNEATARLFSELRKENAQFKALEEKLNLEVQKGNMSAVQMELQLTEAAEAAKSAMLGQGFKDVGTIAQTTEENNMMAEYLKLIAPQYAGGDDESDDEDGGDGGQ